MVRRPRVAIVSTGEEVIAPGSPPRPAAVYDANATSAGRCRARAGWQPVPLGIVGDDQSALDAALERGLATADLVLLSGGTSKGGGDLSYRVLARRSPGIVVHGVALKPGKPICLGAAGVDAGRDPARVPNLGDLHVPRVRRPGSVENGGPATAKRAARSRPAWPCRCNSERGRTEYLLVGLMPGPEGLAAYPMGKGSGSVTTFSRADGFVVIPRLQEYVERGERVRVMLLGRGVEPADLVVIGSHCVGLDLLLGLLAERGVRSRRPSGSDRKEGWMRRPGASATSPGFTCWIRETDTYNAPFLPPGVRLFPGYGRMQGLVYRGDDPLFEGLQPVEAVDHAVRSSLLPDGQPQSGKRHAVPDRRTARWPPAAGIRGRGPLAQRRGRCGQPGPSRLGSGHRAGGPRLRAGVPAAAGRAI